MTESGSGHGVERERLLTGYSGRLSIAVALGWMGVQMGRWTFPPLLPTIIESFGITPSQAGFALTTTTGVSAALHYPGGRLSDRLSRTTLLVASVAVTLLGFLALVAAASSYPFLLAIAVLIGAGIGLFSIPSRALLSDLFVEHRGTAFGIFQAAGRSGSAIAAGTAVAAISYATWQAAFVPVIALLALVLALLHVWSREPYVIARVDLDVRGTFARVFRDGTVRWLVVAYVLYNFTWQGVFGFLPTFLQVEKGLSPAVASAGFAVPFVIGIPVNPLAGRISDRLRRAPVAVGSLAVGAAGLGIVLAASGLPLVVLGVAVFGVGFMAFPPVMQAYLMDVFPDSNMGGDFGAFKTIYMVAGSAGPAYVGFVAERASYLAGFSGLLACLLVSAAIVLAVSR